jgi:endonuclease/exonuclease/phosphatase family metal-dependent hydrolase
MGTVRFSVWNVEWMNDLFTSTGGNVRFKSPTSTVRGPRSGNTVQQRITDIAGVINSVEPDALVIVEGPNTTEELQFFFDNAPVSGIWSCTVQRSVGQSQCIGVAVRTDTGRWTANPVTHFDAYDEASGDINTATNPFHYDSDGDGIEERHRFERRPLYAELLMADNAKFRFLGLHLKSKGIFTAMEWGEWWRTAAAHRKKILAQCKRLRTGFIEPYLAGASTQGIPLIICGDINDGPGFDASESSFDTSGIETLMGDVWRPQMTLGNALFDSLSAPKQANRDFDDIATTRYQDPIFNNTYHNVWIDHILYTRNTPAAWVSGGSVHRNMSNSQPIWRAFPASSDHYPVSATVNLS